MIKKNTYLYGVLVKEGGLSFISSIVTTITAVAEFTPSSALTDIDNDGVVSLSMITFVLMIPEME